MSANIYWGPISPTRTALSTFAPQKFMLTLNAIGWTDNEELDESHLTALKGMAAVFETGTSANPYQQLIDAIEKHGSIHVWAEY